MRPLLRDVMFQDSLRFPSLRELQHAANFPSFVGQVPKKQQNVKRSRESRGPTLTSNTTYSP